MGLLIFAGVGSSDFREQQAPFIESFMREFARRRDVTAVHSKLSNDRQIQLIDASLAFSLSTGVASIS